MSKHLAALLAAFVTVMAVVAFHLTMAQGIIVGVGIGLLIVGTGRVR